MATRMLYNINTSTMTELQRQDISIYDDVDMWKGFVVSPDPMPLSEWRTPGIGCGQDNSDFKCVRRNHSLQRRHTRMDYTSVIVYGML